MGLSLNKIGANANEIDITAVGTKIKHVTTEGEELSCVLMNLLLVDSHLIFGNLNAPHLHDVTDKLHRLVLQGLLRRLFIVLIIIKNFLHQLCVNVCALALNHVEGLPVHQFFFYLILGESAFAFDIVDDEGGWVDGGVDVDWFDLHRLLIKYGLHKH